MPKSKVVPQFKIGDVAYFRRIPSEVRHLAMWSKFQIMGITSRSYVIAPVACLWSTRKLPLNLKGWQTTTSEDDVALTRFVLDERYHIGQILEVSWDEGLIYRVALTLESESAYLHGQLEKFRRDNEQRQSRNSVNNGEANAGGPQASDVSGTSQT